MFSTSFSLSLALLGSATSLALPVDVPEIQVQEHVYENGFRLILARRPMGGMVVARILHGVGSVNDPPGLIGMAHFFEHLVFEGTSRLGTTNWEDEKKILDGLREIERRIEGEKDRLAQESRHRNVEERGPEEVPPLDFSAAREDRLGALLAEHRELLVQRRRYGKPLDINNSLYYWGDILAYASTGVDATQYYSLLPARHLEAFFWVEAEKFEPVFRNFYAARDAVQEQWLRGRLDPERVFAEQMQGLLYVGPFGRRGGGGFELESANPLDAIRFRELYLTPNNSHAVLVGEFDPQEAIRLGKVYFGGLPRGAPPPRVRVLALPPPGEQRLVVEGRGNPRVEIRYAIRAGETPENAAYDLLLETLNGPTGRLANALMEAKDLVTVASASRRSTRHYGYLAFEATPRNNDLIEEVEQSLTEVVDGLMESTVTEPELERARRRAEIAHIQLLADAQAFNRELAFQETLSSWKDVLARPERWADVTPRRLLEICRKALPASRRAVGIYRNTRR